MFQGMSEKNFKDRIQDQRTKTRRTSKTGCKDPAAAPSAQSSSSSASGPSSGCSGHDERNLRPRRHRPAGHSWAVNENVAKIGAKGEQKTEELLNGFAQKAAVLHDLRIPIPGFKAIINRFPAIPHSR